MSFLHFDGKQKDLSLHKGTSSGYCHAVILFSKKTPPYKVFNIGETKNSFRNQKTRYFINTENGQVMDLIRKWMQGRKAKNRASASFFYLENL